MKTGWRACSALNDKPSVGAGWLVPRGFVRKRNGDRPSQQPGSRINSRQASARIDVRNGCLEDGLARSLARRRACGQGWRNAGLQWAFQWH